ncbi:MAG: 2Fe-2S iron-sulfur cluster binding domain-containing protein [Alphaproteobacteria bacterium]|nr:2Fe-2S iron-sulfur cluster binding domain-containing protein [Alphaproteobacteria bacterium]
MGFRVAIRQAATAIEVAAGETILAAALRQGVDYPHGCQSGNCGACKSNLHDGEVELSPYSDYALTAAERAQGLILACRAVPWSDAELSWQDSEDAAIHPRRMLICRVAAIEQATHDTRIVRLAVEGGGPFDFTAGQYATVTFAGQKPRDYSMANRPDEAVLEFHIRHMPGGATSAYVARSLSVGETVTVEGPFGIAHLRARHTGPIVAIAGGSGLAPALSILRTALAAGMRQPMRLFLGVSGERDVYGEAGLAGLAAAYGNFTYEIVLSKPDAGSARPAGYVHAHADSRLGDLDGTHAHLAGPPVMVEAATAMLVDRGLSRHDIFADAFYTEAERARLNSAAALVAALGERAS